MNDATRKPSGDLLLKLHWPPETGALSGAQYVAVELLDTAGLVVASMSVLKEQLLVSMAETKCARWRRKSVPVWLIKKGCDALGSVCLV